MNRFKRYMVFSLLGLISMSVTGCFEEKNPFDESAASFTTIQFQVPDSNLAPPATGGLQLVQPTFDLTVGRYAHASTDVRIQVNLSAPADAVEVYAYNTTTTAQELEASATSVSGSTTLTMVARHVGIGFNAGNLAPLTAGSTDRSVTIRVVARSGGQSTSRIFTARFARR